MDAGAIAGVEDRGRGHLLDHRRSLDHVVRKQLVAREYAGRDPASGLAGRIAFEEHVPRRGVRLGGRGRRPAASAGSSGVSTLPMAVAPKPTISIGASGSAWPNRVAVGGMEVGCQRASRRRHRDGVGNRQLIALADVAGLDTHLDRAPVRGYAVGGKQTHPRHRSGARAMADARSALPGV